jgi:ubiquinone/menaquinone biosynthesis C-methylase UbiE
METPDLPQRALGHLYEVDGMTTEEGPYDYVFKRVAPLDAAMRRRTADNAATFLLPYLQQGMSVVDIGCGQGTITTGLAQAVAPGEVLGFDLQEDHIRYGQGLAEEQEITNLQFRVGDVYRPPCEPESFDVAYANAVISHLSRPDDALRSVWTLLKPGGLIALRDRGGGYLISGLNEKEVRQAYEIDIQVIDATSQNPYGSQTIGEVMHRLCRAAGFEDPRVTASWSVESTASLSARGARSALPDQLAERALELRLTNPTELGRLDEKYVEWLGDADGYMASSWMQVVARKPS